MNRHLRLGITILVFSSFWSGTTHSDEPPLITDRPDQTESAFTVPRGLFQIEGGWGYGERRGGTADVTFQSFPQALLRIGLTDRFELRVGVPGYTIEKTDLSTGSTTARGLVDATAGFKVVFSEERGALPQAAFLGTLLVPSGNEEFSSERVDPAFRFALSHTLNSRLTLGYNVGMLWLTEPDEEGRFDTLSFFDWTVSLGISAAERLGVFVEAFGLSPLTDDGGTLTAFDSGVTWLLTSRLQLDASASVGLSEAAPDWTLGFGASFRFPRSR